MKLVADMHTHTVASGHAYSTILEMVEAAKSKNLEVIAFTEHGMKIPGACNEIYFWNLNIIPREINGITVLKGVEANIIDYEGNIDIPEFILKRLDIVIASLHDLCLKPGTVKENTKAVIKALENPYIDIFGHPDNPIFPVDIDEVVAAAKEYGKMLEMNNKSPVVRKGSEVNALKFAQKAKEYSVMLVCGSDAHITFDVGEFDAIIKIIQEVEIPEELIINTSKEKVLNYLSTRKQRLNN